MRKFETCANTSSKSYETEIVLNGQSIVDGELLWICSIKVSMISVSMTFILVGGEGVVSEKERILGMSM